jgi:high-affinity iron transporter
VRLAASTALVVVAALWSAAGAGSAPAAPWEAAADARTALSDAETDLVLGGAADAVARVDAARAATARVLAGRPSDLARAGAALERAAGAVRAGDQRAFAAARASAWTTILRAAYLEATAAAARGDAAAAQRWLLVREFRPPTRFSRAGADATLALDRLGRGELRPAQARAAVRTDLLDTYDGRLRTAVATVRDATRAGFDARRAEAASSAEGYWRIVLPAFRAQRGASETKATVAAFAALVREATAGRNPAAALREIDRALEGFRAAPLSEAEQVRRAGQLQRFLELVPIEYGRGVDGGRVVHDFEIQEAITFRDGAAAAFSDLESILLRRDRASTRRIRAALGTLGDALAAATRGDSVADPDALRATADEALGLTKSVYPDRWREAGASADFDVIAATLDRVQSAAAEGNWGAAEQARLEAYGIFELGPEQRLRGLAPGLFQKIETLFWYGDGSNDGLVQLVKRKAAASELAATRAALDTALTEAEERIGAGAGSRVSVVANSAIIVFREGLEAVLILAALMASMVGAQRRLRKPLLAGVGLALVASAVTWVVAQTVLGSLAGWGEKLEAVVSLVAIAVLLLILNWFYHRVYWQENLQDLHRKKKRVLAGASIGFLSAQALGLIALGFSSVYREGFETVLFLQALTLDAGAWTVLQGVALGFVGVLAVFALVIALERRLPHKKMLIATGVLITGVLVVMVGHTVQTMQAVGWLAVTPVEGLTLPYWSGAWLGLFPTWEGLALQGAAAVFVVGSYFAAEALRSRRRARILAAPIAAPTGASGAAPAAAPAAAAPLAPGPARAAAAPPGPARAAAAPPGPTRAAAAAPGPARAVAATDADGPVPIALATGMLTPGGQVTQCYKDPRRPGRAPYRPSSHAR